MKELIAGLVWAGIFIGLSYAWGYFGSLGRSVASKHKKVCDVCFRDIERVNAALRRREEELSHKETIE